MIYILWGILFAVFLRIWKSVQYLVVALWLWFSWAKPDDDKPEYFRDMLTRNVRCVNRHNGEFLWAPNSRIRQLTYVNV